MIEKSLKLNLQYKFPRLYKKFYFPESINLLKHSNLLNISDYSQSTIYNLNLLIFLGSARAFAANVCANCMRRPWSVEWQQEHRRRYRFSFSPRAERPVEEMASVEV